MKDPARLRDQCEDPLERALLRAGTSYRTSPDTRIKTLAAVGLASSVAISAGTASPSVLIGLGWAKLAGVVAVAGAVTAVPVGYYAWHQRAEPAAAKVQAPVVPERPKAAPVRTPKSSAAEPIAPVLVDKKESRPKAKAARPSGSRQAPEAAPSSAADLSAELAALDAARAALSGGSPSSALSLLDAYSRAHPRGRLALEAEVLRIDALARSGLRQAAQERARAFLRQRPNSVLASRVRAHLED